MKHTSKFRSLAATLFTIGSLAGGLDAALSITDISGSATGIYVYGEGDPADILGWPSLNPEFWSVTVGSPNVLIFDTKIDVGTSSATLNLSGLEANDDWVSAAISSTGGLPSLTYSGGDTAFLNFANGQTYSNGDLITITFAEANAPVPEPSSALLFGLAALGFSASRRR